MSPVIESAKKRYSICSFSANIGSSPMWSHYTESHRGFCIEYDFKGLGMNNDNVQLMLPVLYRDKSIEIVDINSLDASFCMLAFTIKDISWAYEGEWRMFSLFSEKPYPLVMPKAKAVYSGLNIDRNIGLEKLKHVCSEIEVPLFQI